MSLDQPIWLLLLVPLGVTAWVWPAPTRLRQVMRLAVLILVVLAMARPALRLPDRAGTVVVVADRSRSMPADAAARQKESIDLVQRAMGGRDRLAVVSFGERVAVERGPDVGAFAGFAHEVGGDASNLAEALGKAVALIPPESPGRVLVLSDGVWTGRDPLTQGGWAASRGIAIDYRRLNRPIANDVAIDRMEAPLRVTPGESFMIHAWVRSPLLQELRYELRRGRSVLAQGVWQAPSGLSRLTFRDTADEPGTSEYRLLITSPNEDPVPENNTARALVGTEGPRSILCISDSPGQGLARLLEAGGLRVHTTTGDDLDWSLTTLSNYAGVIVENVPAQRLTHHGMELLATWVQQTGAGLMITGGKQSFGPGGYFNSPLDPILPVSMELRQEHRKLSLAIVVAMDRSGSMTAPAGAGRTKMDLANLGAASVLDLLSPMDEFGVVAVDSQAHVIADLEAVPQNKGPLRSRILRVESMGGGIFVYEALSTAARMLANARASTRHIILFSDAADSEEPGRYKELLEQCAQANITVSVIGLGTPQDVDAPLLEDIAKRGNGRIFFTADANELPQLFAQDTFVVARSAFIDEPTPVHATSGLTTLTGRSLGQPPLAGGYNLCYLREGANLAAVTQDEYAAPFIAAWQAGVGRAVAYTGEADGQFTGPIAQWEHMGELLASLTRWVAGERTQLPEHMMLTQQVDGGVYTIRLHLDPEQPEATLGQLPRVTLLRGRPGQTPRQEQATLQWDATHSLALELPLSSDETVLASVDIPGHGRLTLTPVCLPYSPEFKPESVTRADRTLERLARISGGQERVDLGAIWSALPRRPQAVPVAYWLLLLAAGLVLLEVFERRTGVPSLLPALGRLRRSAAAAPEAGDESPATPPASSTRRRRIQTPTPAQPTTPPAATTTPPRPAPSAAQPESPQQSVLDALRQARTRADQRTRRSQ